VDIGCGLIRVTQSLFPRAAGNSRPFALKA